MQGLHNHILIKILPITTHFLTRSKQAVRECTGFI